MKTYETAAAKAWRLLAEHNRVVAEHMARPDARAGLLRTAADYEARAGQEDERAAELTRKRNV